MVSGFGFSGFGFGFCFLKKTSHFLVNSANHQNRARSFHCSAMMDASDCHWGFVLKEMSWLANDVLKERGRHLNQAKKLSKSIDTYHKSKDGRKLKKAKDEIQAMKKISLRISKDVRKFWMKVDKIIAFKQKGEFDEIRQKAMDKHLVFLVKQTERYTYMIAENMRGNTLSIKEREEAEEEKDEFMTTGKRAIDATSATETSNKRVRFLDDCVSVSADKDDVGDEESEEEEEFIGEDEEDDETTLIEEENKEVLMSHEEELALLEKDKEMSVEELRAMYANIPDEEEGEEEEGEEVDEGEDETDERGVCEMKAQEAMLGDVTNENALDADSSVNLPASLALKTKEEDGNDFGEALRRLELADEAARSVWVPSYHITIFLFCNLLTSSCRLTALSCWRPLCPCENTSTAVLTG